MEKNSKRMPNEALRALDIPRNIGDKYASPGSSKTSSNDYKANVPLEKSGDFTQALNKASGIQNLSNKYGQNDQMAKASGPNRLSPEQDQNVLRRNPAIVNKRQAFESPKKRIKQTLLKRYFPYLVAGSSTAIGTWLGLKEFAL